MGIFCLRLNIKTLKEGLIMKRKFISMALLFVIVTTSIMQLAAQTVPTQTDPNNLIVTGTTETGETFAGTLDLTRFSSRNGQLIATGLLNGTLTRVVNGVPTVISTVTNLLVNLIVTPGTSTCEILDLQLGPLDLNLLGLVVHLDQINLQITAQQGPGNLLGNLLCAVANLLNSGGPLGALAGLLNNILRILG